MSADRPYNARKLCDVEAGKSYTFSATVKTEADLVFAFVDKDGNVVGKVIVAPAGITTWTRVTKKFTAPADAVALVHPVNFMDRIVFTQSVGGKT